jgi:hypothetical protein
MSLLANIATAQAPDQDGKKEEEKKPEKPARQIRFLPVGDLPPFRQEIRDGVAYELPPPEGSIPPRGLMLGSENTEKEKAKEPKEKPVEADLRLNQLTDGFKIPEGAGPLTLRVKGDTGEGQPWLRLQRPEQGDLLAILWREGPKSTWATPRFLIIPDGVVEAPAGKVRFLNISPVTVGVVFGNEKIALQAGKSYQRSVEVGKDLPFKLGAVDASGEPSRFQSDVVTQNPGERTLVLIYRADGVQPRRDLKANVIRERAPGLPPPP